MHGVKAREWVAHKSSLSKVSEMKPDCEITVACSMLSSFCSSYQNAVSTVRKFIKPAPKPKAKQAAA